MEPYVSKEYDGDGISITFPATKAYVLDRLATLGVYDIGNGRPVFIRGDGLVNHFAELLCPHVGLCPAAPCSRHTVMNMRHLEITLEDASIPG